MVHKNKQIRALTFQNLMKVLRKKEEIFGGSMVMELRADHTGCIKNAITTEILVEWHDLDELQQVLQGSE